MLKLASTPSVACDKSAPMALCRTASCSTVMNTGRSANSRTNGSASVSTSPRCTVLTVPHQHTAWAASSQIQSSCRRRQVSARAGAMDVMPTWTLDQIAGMAFGMVMLASVLSAKSIDEWVAKQQRRQLGLCESCGGVYDAATCKQQGCPMKTGQRSS
eukprot:CAMPEP_0202868540 /NCGR_PEP_ID=MMETSP1391-20130828/10935_1 /ASSEMBLY_ACC=CAM_ASM_000867 /TAXON_ID=1034604 /ORGANISM="Chlamydomonas leiostraca, Strain SAG 11-49" /LENGTH=157 /DNA_ID=CAMNT_0049548723 /DNA_START=26 /DNA_END=499 /DNA_ORIENTATION=-